MKKSFVRGNSREFEANFLFATMQMLSKEDILSHYSPTDFDVIILDECHHAGAESYQKIMRYFKPKFWLGMTASPDTNQYDIYSIFEHHIAYEIRLQQALEEDLLCPFHYFGITDLEINGEVFDDNAGVKNFSNLIFDDRVNYVIEKANYYGFSGDRVKGLIFCSRKDEPKEFYFLGEIFAEGNPRQIYMEKTKDNAFEIDYRLDVPVRSDIYDYIVSD